MCPSWAPTSKVCCSERHDDVRARHSVSSCARRRCNAPLAGKGGGKPMWSRHACPEQLLSTNVCVHSLFFSSQGYCRRYCRRIRFGRSISCLEHWFLTKGRFHALRRISATHIGAHRTRQWNEPWRSTWTHPGTYFISFFMTHFQAATTIGLRDRRFSLHPTVVSNAFLWNKWPADDAAGGNTTWLGKKNAGHR